MKQKKTDFPKEGGFLLQSLENLLLFSNDSRRFAQSIFFIQKPNMNSNFQIFRLSFPLRPSGKRVGDHPPGLHPTIRTFLTDKFLWWCSDWWHRRHTGALPLPVLSEDAAVGVAVKIDFSLLVRLYGTASLQRFVTASPASALTLTFWPFLTKFYNPLNTTTISDVSTASLLLTN